MSRGLHFRLHFRLHFKLGLNSISNNPLREAITIIDRKITDLEKSKRNQLAIEALQDVRKQKMVVKFNIKL